MTNDELAFNLRAAYLEQNQPRVNMGMRKEEAQSRIEGIHELLIKRIAELEVRVTKLEEEKGRV